VISARSRPERHPLAELIIAAADGRFPAADGGWQRVPPWRPGLEAVVGFTGHAVFAVAPDITDAQLAGLGANGFGGAHDPRLIVALAGETGWIDSLDVLLVARGDGSRTGTGLVDRPDLGAHPRVDFAGRVRDAPRILGYPDPARSSVAIVSTGLAGLTELSFELEPARRGVGEAVTLIRDALRTVTPGEPVVAAVAPGNAASLRAVLSAGFTPLGSLQLFRRGATP
jgi:hypothetical protein